MFGLDPDTERNIKQAFAKITAIDKVILYGSHAKGNYRNGSDIDITLFGDKLTLSNSVYPLTDELEELNLPYMFDISIFSHIDNEDLIEHIHRAGKVLYLKEKGLPKGDALSLPQGDALSLPKGWEVKKLGEVCDIALGKTPTRSNKKFWDIEKETNNIWLSIRDLSNTQGKEVFDSREYISNSGAKLGNLVKKGTLLASFKLTLGRLAFAGTELYTNEAIASLEIKDNGLDNGYLYHYLTFFDWDAETKGDVKIKGKTLNKAKLKEIKTLIPPLPEQKRIVASLDQAFTAIDQAKANTEKNLKNARELFQSKLQETFDNGKLKIDSGEWEKKKLGEILKLKSGEGLTAKKMIDGPFLVYGGNGITGHYNKFNFEGPQVIVGRVGALCGNIHLVNGKFWLTDNAFRISEGLSDFYKEFVVFMLRQKNLRNFARQAAQPVISNSSLKDIPLVFPKMLDEQKRIANKLNYLSTETKKIETIYQRKITCLDELKKSILQKVFNGEL